MTDEREPSRIPGQSSLWTTPVTVGSGPLREVTVDPSVSADKIRQAVAGVKERASAFTGKTVTGAVL